MYILHALSETALGRALVAYMFDLPRWTLANILFAIALLPAYLAFTHELWLGIGVATLPAVPVVGGMINVAASQTADNAPRLRDAFAYPTTLLTVFIVWVGMVIAQLLLVASASLAAVFVIGILLFSLLMIGVFALYLPSQLKVNSLLTWRNALVLSVSNPIVALGLLALGGIGIWAVWVSKGALIVVMPALWIILAAYTVDDRIKTMQAAQPG
jgi:hypothetical protein